MCIFLCFGNMKLLQTFGSEIFTQSIHYIFFIEQDMNAFKRSIIWSHTIILQPRNSMHTCFRHILLSQYYSQLFRTVITIIKEDNNIAFFNCTIHIRINNRLYKFVSNTFIIRLLHCLNHICSFCTNTVYQQIICFFHTFPTFIAIHCIIATNDRSNLTG